MLQCEAGRKERTNDYIHSEVGGGGGGQRVGGGWRCGGKGGGGVGGMG